MAKSKVLHVRVTPEAHEVIGMAADKDKRTVSDWSAGVLEATATAAVKPTKKKAAR